MSFAVLLFVVKVQLLLVAAISLLKLPGPFLASKVFATGSLHGTGVTWNEPLQRMGAMGQ